MEKRIIQVEEKVPVKLLIPLSIQHMFAMFGASVLVPFLFGIRASGRKLPSSIFPWGKCRMSLPSWPYS